ncbi:MAG TPA: hypothetical protein PKI24_22000, partial [Nitrospira sp.]|nr:hypothetical protein [Nitrospira sp.]
MGTINFTGQSLGGALAQYAAYEYVVEMKKRTETYVPSDVTLTTFNGLGALWGLQANIKDEHGDPAFKSDMLAGIGFSAHYVVANDLVAR